MSEAVSLDKPPRFERIPGGWILRAEQVIALPRRRLFPFFADARNLARITPPAMGFRILTTTPITMGAGTLIDYRVRVAGVPLRWRTLISRWNPPEEFADEQLAGPYAEWIHTHRFTELGPDTTRMEDEVRFRLPLGPLGAAGIPFVKWQLRGIFAYRRAAIDRAIAEGAL